MPRVVVLGLGNVLCGDDGVGVAAIHAFLHAHQAPPGVRIVDGGTLGLALIDLLDAETVLVLVDAVAAGGRMVRDEFAPSWWTLADAAGNDWEAGLTMAPRTLVHVPESRA